MEEEVNHSHLVGKESGTSPEAGKGSSSHNTLSQGKDPTHESLPLLSIRGTISSITIYNILLLL
jgi:hypothetical protein